MYLLTFCSSKQATIGVTPTEIYLRHDLRLPMDLLRESLPSNVMDTGCYVRKLKEHLAEIHQNARQTVDIRSKTIKTWYDRRARGIFFKPGQKIWFHNSRRMNGKAPNLQSS